MRGEQLSLETYAELEALQSKIESQMGTIKVVEYWETILKRLHINKGKVCLKEIHTKMPHKHLEPLEKPFEGEDIMMEQSSRLDEEDSDQDADERKCMVVIEERCVQDLASRPSPEDNFEKEA
ncbi:cactin [Forsythia ovata]|uniref:Cactin n=1 Tax=Forsythia ovata TaxID=205694 RepID=A0ABD1RKM3_9LAMI